MIKIRKHSPSRLKIVSLPLFAGVLIANCVVSIGSPAFAGDGTEGFVLQGVEIQDEAGISVSSAGDVNGDGIDDLIVGAPSANPQNKFAAGASYVVFGRTTGFPALFELLSLFPVEGGDGSEGFVLKGVDEDDESGVSVSSAGDVNGDGIDDLIIGAFKADPNGQSDAGESYVVFGRTTGFPPSIELSSLFPAAGGDGSMGFVLKGIRGPDDWSGRSVSSAGDVNGDGIHDLIIGAGSADPHGFPGAGESYVVFGRMTGFPPSFELRSLRGSAGGDGSEGFVLKGIDPFDFAGTSVSGAGDVNGDGIDDLIIGADGADPGGRSSAGETYVVFGRTTGFPADLELRRLLAPAGGDGTEGFVLKGIDGLAPGDFGDSSGDKVSDAGDVNADGIEDFIIGTFAGSPNGKRDAGESYLVFGRATGYPVGFELRSLLPAAGGDGSEGFVLKGIDSNDFAGGSDRSGTSVSGAGDVNGDGIDDLIIGAFAADPDGLSSAGESYVVFGRTTGFPASFELRSLLPTAGGDGSEGFVLEGIDAFDSSGVSVSGAGDINGDGIDDLIIGAYSAGPNTEGQAYVVFGRSTGFPAVFELSNLLP